MDRLPHAIVPTSAEGKRAVEAYKKAVTTVASAAAYVVLARGMARELFPDELRAVVRRGTAFVRAHFSSEVKEEHTNTVVIRRNDGLGNDDHLFKAAKAYLGTKIDPRTMRRVCLTRSPNKESDGSTTWSTLLSMEPGGSTTDTFDGVVFKWRSAAGGGGGDDNKGKGGESLELSFDAEHTDTALQKYVPFIMSTAEQLHQQDRALRIFLNEGGWRGINHQHPATFDTLAMDFSLKRAVINDIDRFLKRKEYYQRIGKAWKRGYLLYGPPGTGKSSLVAAMANYLRFNLYDLDLSKVHDNTALQRLLIQMPNKSILVIEDIDCCFEAKSREDLKKPNPADGGDASPEDPDDDTAMTDEERKKQRDLASLMASSMMQSVAAPPIFPRRRLSRAIWAAYPTNGNNITLSGLLNFIDGLWSTSGEERIIVFTTNYKDRLDPALMRPGRMDMHIHMGYCGWEAFTTLARNYFAVDDHPLFPEIKELLADVEVTPAEVSEMLLRSEDVDAAMAALKEFLEGKNDVAENAMH